MQILTIGNTTVRTRRNWGCGCAPTVYEIMDGDVVARSQISMPSADDCRTAVRAHRDRIEQEKREAAANSSTTGRRVKAAKKARGVVA